MSFSVKVSVQVDGVADQTLALADFQRLSLQQHVLQHHRFDLDFSCETLSKALNIKAALVPIQAHEHLSGKNITLGWTSRRAEAGGGSFQFKGIITDISVQTDADLVNYYRLSGYSPTFLMEDGGQSRTFVKKTLSAIFRQVLGAYPGNAFARQLQAQGQQVLPYTVQYQETNFHFLSRLAAQQGEWLYYDGTTLRLGREPAKVLPFRSSSAQVFSLSMGLQPSRTEGASYNYRSHAPVRATATPPAAGYALNQFAVEKSTALFTQPQRVAVSTGYDQSQLQRALDGLAASRAGSQVALVGSGEVFATRPGSVLDVQDALGTAYGQFRVLTVRHEIDGEGNYQNQFEAQPEAAATPPPNPYAGAPTGQPELAEVIDLGDPRGLGRLRVRYYWSVATPADAESGWLRVSTPYSGDGKGQLFTPEKGSQVLVGYEQGQAELPVVLGNLFHAQNPQQAKYTTADNHLKGLQTAGGNKVVMSDKKGEQTILLSNTNNKGTAVEVGFKGDGSITIKSNGPVTVLSPDITLEAGAKGTIKLHAKTITLLAEEEVAVTSKQKSITLKAAENIAATATKEVQVKATSKLGLDGGGELDLKAGKIAKSIG